MKSMLYRSGPLLYLGAGIILIAVGIFALDHLTTNLWLFDPSVRYDILQALGEDRATSSMLLEAALPEMLTAFLASLMAVVVGFGLPVCYYLNRRFGEGVPHPLVVTRQAMWLGFWVAICAWLQMFRALNVAVALLILGVLILFELLLQIRGKADAEAKTLLEV